MAGWHPPAQSAGAAPPPSPAPTSNTHMEQGSSPQPTPPWLGEDRPHSSSPSPGCITLSQCWARERQHWPSREGR